ncbi:hypothetical protein HDK90DRAFT_523516 [Phyllosticta capitalensis]|uniref:Uncharacterized protein n=1 Tax=Phyllosticta capitalensis TaxID=121624 RepID=A0ABR1YWQ9_9PEZI
MPNTTQKESLSPAEPLQRAHSDPGYSRENEYKEGVADETPTEKDSSYDGTDSDAESMSSNILHNFAEWKARLKREAAAELNLSSPDELSSANLRHFTRALHPECPIEDDGYESEDESEEDLDENGRPIARLTKLTSEQGYKRSNVTDSDDDSESNEDEATKQKAHNRQDSTTDSSTPSTPPQEATAGASAPSTPSSDGVKKLAAYGWTPRRKSSLEEFPPFDFDYIPYSRPTDIVVSRHTDRAPSRGRRARTASFGPSVQQNHLKRAGFVPVPYDVAMARAVEIASLDDPAPAPDASKHPLYAKQTLEIPPRIPPFYNKAKWTRPPIAYRALDLLDSDLKDCCLNAPTCNDCNTKICADCGSTCAPDPGWCVVGGCTKCPVFGGNICRYHVDKWEAKGRPG